MYRKQIDTAMVAMSALASAWTSPRRRLSASELAEMNGLPAPTVSKTLHALARAGLVAGAPGPGGGYVLARDPAAISLWDVLTVFRRGDFTSVIPFATQLGGESRPTAVQNRMRSARAALETLLVETSIADLGRPEQGRIPLRAPSTEDEDVDKEMMP